MGSEHLLGEILASGISKLYDKVEKGEWPQISIGQIKEYLGSEEFLGTGLWLWKEMRKKK